MNRNWLLILTIMVLLYTSVYGQGLEVIGSCSLTGYAYGYNSSPIYVYGNYAYTSEAGTTVFSVIDITNPYRPIKIASINTYTFDNVQDISVSGDYAYLAALRKLAIINIARPDSPIVVSLYSYHLEQGHRLFVRKGLLYLANCYNHFPIMNISDPASPQVVGVFDSLGWSDAMSVYLDNIYAYFVVYNEGLFVTDISNQQAPYLIGNFPTPGILTCDVCVSGDYAYLLSDRPNQLTIVNISNPSNPQQVRVINYDTWGHWLYLYSNYLFVGHRYLTIYDISDPGNPLEIVNYTDIGDEDIQDIFVSGELIYARRVHSITIFRFETQGIGNNKALPKEVSLHNYPNPFNPSTNISFTIPSPQQARLEIFDLLGRRVRVLANQHFEASEHSVVWDGTDQIGQASPSGIYFYRLSGAGISVTNKMVLLR